ncbi:type II toxin-antitoxin system Phd/YefM family antitoxin [Thauera sp. SDU_THAU2]|uniref:type II toxin-antitoxin system Phd/YefM family antitoxin n=1 Tax=Thauera sp. SDU_THAU2 TaxID=3136633 RepID=UPI00312021F8
MRTLTLAETKSRFSAVIDQVIAGEEIVITRHGQAVARIIPERKREIPGKSPMIDELRDFLEAQPVQPRSATEVVREVRDGKA